MIITIKYSYKPLKAHISKNSAKIWKCLLFPSFANKESDVVGIHDLPKSPACHNAFVRIALRRFWLSAKGSLHKTTLLLIPVLRAMEHWFGDEWKGRAALCVPALQNLRLLYQRFLSWLQTGLSCLFDKLGHGPCSCMGVHSSALCMLSSV